MKKLNWIVSIVVLLSMLLAAVGYAQYADPWYTAYQVVNMGDGPAVIVVDYYDSSGVKQTTAQKTFNNVPANGSILVLQFSDDPNLGTGRYSAVITADQPIAAVANQQLNPTGAASYTPIPPFSSYSGQGSGGSQVTLPAVMHNWYGYYTEIFIMNVGDGAASDVDITYIPGELDGETTGATGQTDLNNSIAKYASLQKSQETQTALGAPAGNTHVGRFLGSAIITADKPIIAVVNQHNPGASKLMTYNGFTGGAQTIYAPSYMRGYNNYYTTLLVANPSDTATAHVEITYTPDTSDPGYNEAEAGSTVGTVVVSHDIAPQTALTRYDGPPATDEQSDLDDHDVTGHAFVKFYGSVKVTSDIDVMVMVNVEARKKRPDGSPAPGQAGSYNGIANTEASDVIVAPVILSSYYKYYTTLLVQNTTGTAGSCDVTYTSDGVSSSVKNHSETYTHVLPANGSFTVYEGEPGGVTSGDINTDPAWMSAGKRRFIGSAIIDCTQPVVAFVNEEKGVPGLDSMYTMNTFSK
jgi:hypothetical protein